MAREIEIRYCRHCGQLESMRSTLDEARGQNVIVVGCACGAEEARITTIGAREPYYLAIETRLEEAKDHDDPDSGDVPAGGEAGRENDA